jgi:hypothetical protein
VNHSLFVDNFNHNNNTDDDDNDADDDGDGDGHNSVDDGTHHFGSEYAGHYDTHIMRSIVDGVVATRVLTDTSVPSPSTSLSSQSFLSSSSSPSSSSESFTSSSSSSLNRGENSDNSGDNTVVPAAVFDALHVILHAVAAVMDSVGEGENTSEKFDASAVAAGIEMVKENTTKFQFSNVTDAATLLSAIRNVDFNGAAGRVRFNMDGTRSV